MGLLLAFSWFFFTIQSIWIVLVCCLFYNWMSSIGEVLFKSLIGVIFEAGNETRENFFNGLGAEQN